MAASDAPVTLSRAAALAVLRFHADAGVLDAVGDAAVDRFALGQAPTPRLARPGTRRAPALPASARGQESARSLPRPLSAPAQAPGFARDVPDAADTAAVSAARERAASATSLEELRALLADFDDCPLKATARNLVFADGNPEADLMLVGEAPGRDEDARGLPFVGRSGQLLDKMLAAIGRDRSSAYITNVIAWRPPGNRTPSTIEVETCRPFAVRHIELVKPKVLVCLGGASAKLLLGTTEGIKRLRGRWHAYDAAGHPVAAIATLHPAYLLRTPIDKRLAWRDLLSVRERLESATPAG